MILQERIAICKRCKNREFDPKQGIVCKLTGKKPNFESECPEYQEDEKLVEQEKMEEEKQQEVTSLDEKTYQQLLTRQSFGYALAGGLMASVLGAVIWAAITVATGYQIGYMAILVGFIVGFSVRYFGIGFSLKFGILGGVLSLFGCLLGNLLSQVVFIAHETSYTYLYVLQLLDWETIKLIYKESFSPMDVLFYAIAVYEGLRFSYGKITHKLLEELAGEPGKELPSRYRYRQPLIIVGLVVILATLLVISRGATGVHTNYYEDTNVKASSGVLKNGLMEGEWTGWYPDGETQWTGHFSENRQEGFWQWFSEDGELVRTGSYKAGLEEGIWIDYYPDGSVSYQSEYKTGRRNGPFTGRYEDGTLAVTGNYLRDELHGKYVSYYESGKVSSTGEMNRGMNIGDWTFYYPSGQPMLENRFTVGGDTVYILNAWNPDGRQTVVDGSGEYTEYYESGETKQRGKVKEGWRSGEWKTYSLSGQLLETGIYEGGDYRIMKRWNASGQLEIQDGNGTYTAYYDDGTLAQEGTVKNGRFNGNLISYYPSGVILSDCSYKEGKIDGPCSYYEESGNINLEGSFIDGKQEGEWKWYHSDGQLSSQVHFKNGQKEGAQIFRDASGTLLRTEYYEAGTLVKEELPGE